MSDAKKGKNHSDDTRQIMSDTDKKIDHSGRFKKGHEKIEGSGKPLQAIEVINKKNNQTTTYDSIHEAARALNLPSHKAISNYITNNQVKPYKG